MTVLIQPPLAGWTAGQTIRVVLSRRWVLFAVFSSAEFTSVFGTVVTGAFGSHESVKPKSLLHMEAVIAPGPLFERFTASASGSLEPVSRNIGQSRTLAALREALLPKLQWGEGRVKKAECPKT